MAEHAAGVLVDVDLRPTGIAAGVVVVDDDNVKPAVAVVVTEERVARNVGAAKAGNDRIAADLVEHTVIVSIEFVSALPEV